MAITFFEDSSQTSGDLEFAKDFLTKNPKEEGRQFTVQQVVKASSGKGYMVSTSSFMCWLWNKSNTTKQLIDALQFYCEANQGYTLIAVLDKKAKDGYRLGVDFDLPCVWYTTKNGSFQLTPVEALSMDGGNPFLPTAPSPIPVQEVPQEAGVRAVGKKTLRSA